MSQTLDMSKHATVVHPPDVYQDFYPNRSLASNGPYRDYIALMLALVPKVATADPKNKAGPLESRLANVTMLNLKERTNPYCREFKGANDLQAHFDRRRQMAKPSPSGPPARRIYILESLSADFIAVFGSFFYMDPSFFAEHEQVQVWAKSHYGTRITENLPSLADPEYAFCLPYFEMLFCKGQIEDFQINCRATGRHGGITRIDGKFEQEIVLRRKCSFWSRQNEDGGWDVVMLTDPPLKEVVQKRKVVSMPNSPYQGGYPDFIPRLSSLQNLPSGPPRTSLRDDLVYYWSTNYSLISSLSSPTDTTLFFRKIIASHYMLLLTSMRAIVSSLEWHLSRRDDLSAMQVNYVEAQWSDIQALNRRCAEYIEDVERIMLALGIKVESPDFSTIKGQDWKDSTKDFQLVYARLKALKARYEVLLGSITGLAGISGSRESVAGNRLSLLVAKRSFREAKNVKILTLIGMVFIPLAFICGLFSMNDSFLPGSSKFWVFWVTALPVIVVVFLVSVVANRGYDDDAGTWSFGNIWWSAKGLAEKAAGVTEK